MIVENGKEELAASKKVVHGVEDDPSKDKRS